MMGGTFIINAAIVNGNFKEILILMRSELQKNILNNFLLETSLVVLLLLASFIASSFDHFLSIHSHPRKGSILMFEMHPFHLHGYSFFVVGRGHGNYDPNSSPITFNVINPPFRNTYAVLAGSRVAIRFKPNNLGWFSYYQVNFLHTKQLLQLISLQVHFFGNSQIYNGFRMCAFQLGFLWCK